MRFDKHEADFYSHHIEGMAAHGHTPFSVPLISEVLPGLWQGGCKNLLELPDEFGKVVSLYPWEKYVLPDGCSRTEYELYDDGTISHLAHTAASEAYNAWQDSDLQVLVHCQAGLNRSGLVAGLVLIQSGYSPSDAIALLREKRCDAVLCNKTFERYLLSQA